MDYVASRPFISFGGPISLAFLLALSLVGATVLSETPASQVLVLFLGLSAGLVVFLRTELSIHFLIFAMLLSPEISVGTTSGATLDRPITLRLDDFLIVIISGSWFLKSAFYKELDLIRRTPLNGAIFLYCLTCIVATMVGVIGDRVDPASGALFVLKYLEYFLVFWMVVNNTREETQVRRYLMSLLTVGFLVSIVGLLQAPAGARITAPFEGATGEPNTLGGYLLFLSVVFGSIGLSTRKWRLFVMPSLVALLLALVYTQSRSSYLGFLSALVILPVLTKRYWFLSLIALFVLVVSLSPALMPGVAYDRIMYTFNQADNLGQVSILGQRVDTSTSARLLTFADASGAFLERPLLGWGITGWRFLDAQYFRTLVETGMLGLIAFAFLMFGVLKMAFRAREFFRSRDEFYFGFASGLIAGSFGLLVHAIGSNTFTIVRIMEPFWLCCGLLVVLPELWSEKFQPDDAPAITGA